MSDITINTELGPFTGPSDLINKWAKYNTWPSSARLRRLIADGLDGVEFDEYGRVAEDVEAD